MSDTIINGEIKTNKVNLNQISHKASPIVDNKESCDSSKRNAAKWMIGATALATGIALTVAGNKGYLGKSIKEFLVGAEKTVKKEAETKTQNVTEEVKNTFEKLPSRADIHTEKGIHLNKKGLLVTGEGDKEKLFTGTYSYSIEKGGRRNISESVMDGSVTGRIITTEKATEKPIEKHYNHWYSSDRLREIVTEKEGVKTRTFANQKALQQYRAALRYTPKTPEEIKALEEQGIKYEVVDEVIHFTPNQHGITERTHIKEIYTYPENSIIEKKEVFYGAGSRNTLYSSHSDLHAGKEITLTFRKPIETSDPHYTAKGITVELDDNGFVTHLPGQKFQKDLINSFGTVEIPLYSRNNEKGIYEQIKDAINAEYPQDAMNAIKYGTV